MHLETHWFDEATDLFYETYTRLPNQSAIIIEPPEHSTSVEFTSAGHGTPFVKESTQLVPVAPDISPPFTDAIVFRAEGPARDQLTKKR